MPTLNWIGKEAVVDHHRKVPTRLLDCDRELSFGDPEAENLLVEGDNLEALKALLPRYRGQVKCIYIDPPYNTGNEGWVYNDNVNDPRIKKWLGEVVGKEAEDLCRHDKWLCMMYPRLALLREFLREDGAIFVSIADHENHSLRMVLDEVFGPSNFIATIVWQKKQSPQNDAINLSDMHEYVIVFARKAKQNRDDADGWNRNLLTRTAEANSRYRNPDDDPRGPWTAADFTCNKTRQERPNLFYPIINPHSGNEVWPSERRVWLMDPTASAELLRDNRLWWGASGTNFPRLKKFLSEVAVGIVPSTWWGRDFAGDNQEARRELRQIFTTDEMDFATPKPTRLIRRILEMATDKNSLVMDSFAGSGTTGHAVADLNAEDGGSRRCILVEIEPNIARNITRERLRRVIEPPQEAQREREREREREGNSCAA